MTNEKNPPFFCKCCYVELRIFTSAQAQPSPFCLEDFIDGGGTTAKHVSNTATPSGRGRNEHGLLATVSQHCLRIRRCNRRKRSGSEWINDIFVSGPSPKSGYCVSGRIGTYLGISKAALRRATW
jgi:hypothetical protein